MSELMQGRGLENLDTFEIPTFDMDLVSDSFNLEAHFIDSNGKMGFSFLGKSKSFSYAPWVYKGEGSKAEYTFLCEIVKEMDKEMYLREYTYLDFYSCQMIVPSLSEVYPIEDMVYQNRNIGKFIRRAVLSFQNYPADELLEMVESLEDSLNMEKYLGVIFANNFHMCDLKAQLHLLLGNEEDALAYFALSSHPLKTLLCEMLQFRLQNLKWSEYASAFCALFGENTVLHVKAILDKKAYFIDVSLHEHYTNMLKMYDTLAQKKVKIAR